MSWQDKHRTFQWGSDGDELPHVLMASGNMNGKDCSVIKTNGRQQANYWLKRATVPSRHRNQIEGKTPLSFLRYPRMNGTCITLSNGWADSKMRCQERNEMIKEELMAEMWKPSRVEKMLESGWEMIDS